MAFFNPPSPTVFAISAPPPVPNIKPIHPNIIRKGIIKLTAVNAVLPTKFDTKNPSTTPYIAVKINIIIDGNEYLSNFL